MNKMPYYVFPWKFSFLEKAIKTGRFDLKNIVELSCWTEDSWVEIFHPWIKQVFALPASPDSFQSPPTPFIK